MSIQAVVFDIGGVLEITQSLVVGESWEARLGLDPGEMAERMGDVWEAGGIDGARLAGIHAVLYQDNAQAIKDIEALLNAA